MNKDELGTAPSGVNPYVGPVPYSDRDWDRFFGRDRELETLESLIGSNLVSLLFAPSGAGKSSLLNAGLIPHLRGDRKGLSGVAPARMEVLRPGRVAVSEKIRKKAKQGNVYVFAVLSEVAAEMENHAELTHLSIPEFLKVWPWKNTDGLRLLIVDQFEELFATYPERNRERREFVRQISAALVGSPSVLSIDDLQDIEMLRRHLAEPSNDIQKQIADRIGPLSEQADDKAIITIFNSLILSGDLLEIAEQEPESARPFLDRMQQRAASRDEVRLNRFLVDEVFPDVFRPAEAGDPRLRVLFAMREDYLGHVESYRELLPDGLRATMRLMPLGREAAIQAIEMPAVGSGKSFEENVPMRIVDALLYTDKSDADDSDEASEYVDLLQLQVVCQKLWDITPPESKINLDEDIANQVVSDTLATYYKDGIDASMAEAKAMGLPIKEWTVRSWFGEELINDSNQRVRVSRGREYTATLPNAMVDILVGQNLLRREKPAGLETYELLHDRFRSIVRKANRDWLAGQPLGAGEEIQRFENFCRSGDPATLRLTQIEVERYESLLASQPQLSISALAQRVLNHSKQALREEAEKVERAEAEAREKVRIAEAQSKEAEARHAREIEESQAKQSKARLAYHRSRSRIYGLSFVVSLSLFGVAIYAWSGSERLSKALVLKNNDLTATKDRLTNETSQKSEALKSLKLSADNLTAKNKLLIVARKNAKDAETRALQAAAVALQAEKRAEAAAVESRRLAKREGAARANAVKYANFAREERNLATTRYELALNAQAKARDQELVAIANLHEANVQKKIATDALADLKSANDQLLANNIELNKSKAEVEGQRISLLESYSKLSKQNIALNESLNDQIQLQGQLENAMLAVRSLLSRDQTPGILSQLVGQGLDTGYKPDEAVKFSGQTLFGEYLKTLKSPDTSMIVRAGGMPEDRPGQGKYAFVQGRKLYSLNGRRYTVESCGIEGQERILAISNSGQYASVVGTKEVKIWNLSPNDPKKGTLFAKFKGPTDTDFIAISSRQPAHVGGTAKKVDAVVYASSNGRIRLVPILDGISTNRLGEFSSTPLTKQFGDAILYDPGKAIVDGKITRNPSGISAVAWSESNPLLPTLLVVDGEGVLWQYTNIQIPFEVGASHVGTEKRLIRMNQGGVSAMAVSAGSGLVATAGFDLKISIHETTSGTSITSIALPEPIRALTFTKQDKYLVGVGFSGDVIIVDVAAKQLLGPFSAASFRNSVLR